MLLDNKGMDKITSRATVEIADILNNYFASTFGRETEELTLH